MANLIIENQVHFKVFLATLKGFVSATDAKEFATFCADYNRTHSERLKHTSDAAERELRAIRCLAEDDPTAENIAALASCSPDEIRARHANALESLAVVENKILSRAKPLLLRVRDAVLPIVEKELARVESDHRATFARYGAVYDPATDIVLKSLARWRNIVNEQFSSERVMLRPEQVEERLGSIRAK
jgi:hypothetical protein